jgi:hypothetical protein
MCKRYLERLIRGHPIITTETRSHYSRILIASILVRIFSHLRRKIRVDIHDRRQWNAEDLQAINSWASHHYDDF